MAVWVPLKCYFKGKSGSLESLQIANLWGKDALDLIQRKTNQIVLSSAIPPKQN